MNKQYLYEDIYRQEDDERELDHVSEEGRHVDSLLLSDGFHHEVRSVTNISQRSKEDCTH